jgi:cytochrome c
MNHNQGLQLRATGQALGYFRLHWRYKCFQYIKGPSRENAMSNRLFASAFATLSLVLSTALASAQQFGTAEEARAMLDRAVAALKSDEATALREISDANNKNFHDRDLYVSCFNTSDGKFTAFPSLGMIGVDVRTFNLGDDPIGQRAFDAIQGTPEGSVVTMDYNSQRSGKPALKQTLETRIGNESCGVAYYK